MALIFVFGTVSSEKEIVDAKLGIFDEVFEFVNRDKAGEVVKKANKKDDEN